MICEVSVSILIRAPFSPDWHGGVPAGWLVECRMLVATNLHGGPRSF